MKYHKITTLEELEPYTDQIILATRRILKRAGETTGSVENVMHVMIQFLKGDNHFIMVITDDNNEQFLGYVFAILLHGGHSWVEIINVYCPNMPKPNQMEIIQMIEDWARSSGACKIIGLITRRSRSDLYPGEGFFNYYHKPMGYEVKGIVVEKAL